MSKNKLAKDRLLIVFLVILGIGTLWLGFSDIGSKIKGISKNESSKNDKVNEENLSEGSIVILKNTDTDNDGLSDYDELNVYHTSIYLADSDSDGFSDGEEVSSNHDPNCPKGSNCGVVGTDNNTSVVGDGLLGDYLSPDNELDVQAALDAERIFSGQATVEEVKELLMSQGMSKADLNKIPDQEIMKLYAEMIKNSDSSTGSSIDDQASLDAERILSGQATVDEVKDLLVAQGILRDQLDQMPDQEIMKLYNEMVESYK
jgi:hypothetical protein